MKIKTMMTVAICLISVMQSKAQNPVIHHVYTADPAPAVHEGNDSLWFYCDIDEGGSYFTMNEWRAFSTVDMVNWTDHGSALPLTQFKWAQATLRGQVNVSSVVIIITGMSVHKKSMTGVKDLQSDVVLILGGHSLP